MTRQKLSIFLIIVITLCIQASCSVSDATEPNTPKLSPDMIAAGITQADELFRQREDIAKLRDSVAAVAKLRNPESRIFEVEWKFAKYSYFLGQRTTDQKEAEAIFTKGRDAGTIASNMEPSKPDGYFWYGANLGELCRQSPITVGLKSVNDVKDAMNKVIAIQPNYQNSSAYDALAQVEMESRMYDGSAEKAVEFLEKALQTEKRNAALRLHLAEALLALKKEKEARGQIDKLMQMEPDPDYLPEHKDTVAKAKKLLETKF